MKGSIQTKDLAPGLWRIFCYNCWYIIEANGTYQVNYRVERFPGKLGGLGGFNNITEWEPYNPEPTYTLF